MMEPWQAIYDEYPSGALDFGVIRGDDRSTLDVLSQIWADDFERLNSATEFEQRMDEARQEADFRNALDLADVLSRSIDANPENLTP